MKSEIKKINHQYEMETQLYHERSDVFVHPEKWREEKKSATNVVRITTKTRFLKTRQLNTDEY